MRVATQPAETATLLSSQRKDEFLSVSPEAHKNLYIHQTQTTSTATGEVTSFSTLTPEDVLAMKQQNPAEALRKL